MMMTSSASSSLDRANRRPAYSLAMAGSWIEHGPTMTSRRSSAPVMTAMASRRPFSTVALEAEGWRPEVSAGTDGETERETHSRDFML